jgi:hypothetical protein
MMARSQRFVSCLGSLVLAISLAAVTSACGGGGSDGTTSDTSNTCADVRKLAAAELSAPAVTFESDVAPTLVKSCTFSPCHGSRSAAGNHGLFLGAKSADDMVAVKTALLAKSHALPSMPYVTPGDPEHSFLLHKLDGSLCGLDAQCVGGSCGKSMPDGNDLLAETSRDAIRRWVAQGAK